MGSNLLHRFPFDAIDLDAVRDRDNNVLHDLGALRDGASHFFRVREREARRVPHAPALASRSRFPAAGHVVHLK